ncbi:MAG: iron-sulfur cluster repair di-iron protein [Candidatus Sericytochromatia bacterium]
MITISKIDVTVLEPRMKHPTIFKKFDEITAGESFIISNDHDPKPLYYQLLGERGNIFSWEYIENGPDNWLVKIQKNNSTKEDSIGELVAKDLRKAEVFKKFNIDFCCGGKKTLSQVCNDKQINIKDVESELEKLDSTSESVSQNYNEWSLDFLVDFIINTHHKYVKNSLPILLEYTAKVAKVHGKEHLEVVAIYDLFKEASDELNLHIMKEETILFPYIKQLVNEKNSVNEGCSFGTVKNPIRMMEHEHDVVGNIFKTIRELSNDYTPPEDACTTYKLSYKKLEEFENDLHQHIHLENNILFPKSIKLESELL